MLISFSFSSLGLVGQIMGEKSLIMFTFLLLPLELAKKINIEVFIPFTLRLIASLCGLFLAFLGFSLGLASIEDISMKDSLEIVYSVVQGRGWINKM